MTDDDASRIAHMAIIRARLKVLGEELDRRMLEYGFGETCEEMERRLCPDRFRHERGTL